MASQIKGGSPKVRNANRTPGYWITLARGRANKDRALPSRSARQGINYPSPGDVGSAAYRRTKKVR